jgi:dTDP-4-dehydrorhamnose reductase
MRILVTGGSGLLGEEVCALGTQEGHEVFAGFHSNQPQHGRPTLLDLSKPDIIGEVRAVSPELIIHTGGLTDVDRCEQEVELAERVNGTATGEIAKAARRLGAQVTYVSTDYVFDGEGGNYDETAKPNPISQYGRSKLLGETLLSETGGDYCIARPSVIYGWGRSWRPNYALFVVKALEEKREVKAAHDMYCSPTLNTSLAQMLLELSTRRLTGVFHVAGTTRTSRLDFAKEIAAEFSLNPSGIIRVDSRMLNLRARRPHDSSLSVGKAARTLNAKPLKLSEALRLFHKTRPS